VVLVTRKVRRQEVNAKKSKNMHVNFSQRQGRNNQTDMTSKISNKNVLRKVLLKSSSSPIEIIQKTKEEKFDSKS
jgi:hypothetical protein